MNSLSDIKRRIAVIKQTRQITGAMETISIAKMRKALDRFDKYNEYLDTLRSMVYDIAEHHGTEIETYLNLPKIGRKLVIVVSSDKGLCGGFNHDIFDFADSVIDADTVVMPIGQMSAEHYRNKVSADLEFPDCASAPSYANAKRIAEAVVSAYAVKIRKVTLVYTRLVSHTLWEASSVDILPLPPNTEDSDMYGKRKERPRMSFEPSPKEVFKILIPLYLSGVIYGALINSSAAEHSARRAAMAASTKNADDSIEALSIEYNRARQSAVTEQITEMISSTRAFGKQGETQ